VKHRVGLPRTSEGHGRKTVQAVIGKLKAGVLPGDKQPRRLAEIGKGMGDWA
jgi:hypothetical protein